MQKTDVILIIEDCEDDILLLQRAFQKAAVTNPLQYVRTGKDAMDYLSGAGKFANRREYPLPVLILLDLKLPGVDGFEVLSWLRKQKGFRDVPVAVLATSSGLRTVNRAYRLGANSFIIKDTDFQATVDQVVVLQKAWLLKTSKPEASCSPGRKPPSES